METPSAPDPGSGPAAAPEPSAAAAATPSAAAAATPFTTAAATPSAAGPGTPIYPLSLRLEGRRVLVVGGGPVALRRVAGLRAAGAQVVVVAPRLTPATSTAPGWFSPARTSRRSTRWSRPTPSGSASGAPAPTTRLPPPPGFPRSGGRAR